MTYYDFNLLETIKQNIRKKNYNPRKILGLPNITTLPISREEKKFLAKVYGQIQAGLWDDLNKCINFYEKYRIIYGKSKHGLVFHSGISIGQDIVGKLDWKNSSIIAYDRKNEQDLPKDHYVAKRNQTMIPYYKVISKLNFNDMFSEDIGSILYILEIIHYICQNHKTSALNCGETYFPYERKGHDIYLKLPSGLSITKNDKFILRIFQG